MVKEIIKDTEFLSQSSVPATKDDMQVVVLKRVHLMLFMLLMVLQ